MTDQAKPTNSREWLYAAEMFFLGLGCCIYLWNLEPLPAWMNYLNWQPGMYTNLSYISHMSRAFGIAIVLMGFAGAIAKGAYPLLLGLLSWPVALWLYVGHADDIMKRGAYESGVAQWECFHPESRECLMGKFERAEMLHAPNNPKEPIEFNERERAVLEKFIAYTESPESKHPPMEGVFDAGPKYHAWRATWVAKMEEIFQDYPSIWAEPSPAHGGQK